MFLGNIAFQSKPEIQMNTKLKGDFKPAVNFIVLYLAARGFLCLNGTFLNRSLQNSGHLINITHNVARHARKPFLVLNKIMIKYQNYYK